MPSAPLAAAASKTARQQSALADTDADADAVSRALDDRWRRLTDKVLPSSPYVLTVPTERPYNLSPQQLDELCYHTPFDRTEASLQYVSFFLDWDSGLILPVGGWANDQGDMVDATAIPGASPLQRTHQSSDRSPLPATIKKKISLADYKARGTGTKGSAEGSVNGASAAITPRSNSQAMLSASQATLDGRTPRSGPASRPLSSDEVQKQHTPELGEPPAKRQRQSPPTKVEPASPAKLRQLIELPPPISPTLPLLIEEELARLASHNGKYDGTNGRARSPPRPESGKRASPPEKSAKASSKHSDKSPLPPRSQDRTAPDSPKSSRFDSSHTANQNNQTISREARPQSRLDPSPRPRQRLIVRLKIARARRKDWLRLIQLQSRSGRASSRDSKRLRAESPPRKKVEQRNGSLHREPVDSISAKHTNAEVRRRESTPDRQSPRRNRGRERTPSREHRNSLATTSDHAIRTPQAPPRSATPLAPPSIEKERDRDTSRTGPSSSTTSMRGSVPPVSPSAGTSFAGSAGGGGALLHHDEMRRLQRRHFKLAVELKREADARFKTSSTERGSGQAESHALAMTLESILAFMVGYSVGDEMSRQSRTLPDPNSSWATIHGLVTRFVHAAAPYPDLQGLGLLIGAVCKRTHWTQEYEHGSTGSSTSNSTAAPTSDSTASTAMGSSQFTTSAARTKRLWDESRRSFHEGHGKLAPTSLAQTFPKSWKASSRIPLSILPLSLSASTGSSGAGSSLSGSAGSGLSAPMSRSSDVLSALGPVGPFVLPFSEATTALEAVRAGRILLSEWCAREKVDWHSRLG